MAQYLHNFAQVSTHAQKMRKNIFFTFAISTHVLTHASNLPNIFIAQLRKMHQKLCRFVTLRLKKITFLCLVRCLYYKGFPAAGLLQVPGQGQAQIDFFLVKGNDFAIQ